MDRVNGNEQLNIYKESEIQAKACLDFSDTLLAVIHQFLWSDLMPACLCSDRVCSRGV